MLKVTSVKEDLFRVTFEFISLGLTFGIRMYLHGFWATREKQLLKLLEVLNMMWW